jgi:hypothetical protein
MIKTQLMTLADLIFIIKTAFVRLMHEDVSFVKHMRSGVFRHFQTFFVIDLMFRLWKSPDLSIPVR